MEKGSYLRLLIMAVVSFPLMYAVMFLNIDRADHIYFSLNRIYMSLLMVAPMSTLMLIIMKKMYSNKRLNLVVISMSLTIFVLALVCLRTQAFISDRQYMKAMIPHHSSAILTSKHAQTKDVEVKQLSEQIIASQQREIEQMKLLLQKLEK